MPTIPRKQTPDPRKKKQQRDRPQDKRYWSGAWRRARLAYIKKHPTCIVCDRLAKVVDHINPSGWAVSFGTAATGRACASRAMLRKVARKRICGRVQKSQAICCSIAVVSVVECLIFFVAF